MVNDAEFAAVRGQLVQLRTALGAGDPDQAETAVRALVATIDALVAWAQAVTPPFAPPGPS